jgi:hypothetical protein
MLAQGLSRLDSVSAAAGLKARIDPRLTIDTEYGLGGCRKGSPTLLPSGDEDALLMKAAWSG